MNGLLSYTSFMFYDKDDANVWMLENDGSFSVKSFFSQAAKLIVKLAALNRQKSNLIWKALCPKKVKVFLWIFSFEELNTCRIQEFFKILLFLPIGALFVKAERILNALLLLSPFCCCLLTKAVHFVQFAAVLFNLL